MAYLNAKRQKGRNWIWPIPLKHRILSLEIWLGLFCQSANLKSQKKNAALKRIFASESLVKGKTYLNLNF